MKYRVSLDFSQRDFEEFLSLLIKNPDYAYSKLTASVFNLIRPDDYPVCDISYRLDDEFPLSGVFEDDGDHYNSLFELISAYGECREFVAASFGIDLEDFAEGVPLGQEEGESDD